jgi:hypothetical protein
MAALYYKIDAKLDNTAQNDKKFEGETGFRRSHPRKN